jgi:(1->4)-alpha-D-glucan 1-alpha-D-glucosylmutase
VLGRARALILAQAALKLTLPGIPDIYQGCEVACFALTDPDNRRAVDFDALSRGLADPASLASDLDREKLGLTARLLRLRRENPEMFLRGTYEPEPAGSGLSFIRRRRATRLAVDIRLHGMDLPAREGRTVWPDPDAKAGPVRVTLHG